MAIDMGELEGTMAKLRLEIIECLTELAVEINSLKEAIIEAPVSTNRLLEPRKQPRKTKEQIRNAYCERISLPLQFRSEL